MNDNNVRLLKNYIYNVGFKIFAILTPLVTTPYISRVLGASNLGIYSYTGSIRSYFVVAGSLGFPLYGQREIARHADNEEGRSEIFFEIFIGQVGLLSISLSLYLLCTLFVFRDNQIIFGAQMLGIIGAIINVDWLFQGLEEFRVTVLRSYFIKLFSIICLFIFVKTPDDLLIYTISINIANVIGNAMIFVELRKFVRKPKKIVLKNIVHHVRPAFLLGIPFYATELYMVIDQSLLGALSKQFAEVGYYSQSEKILDFSMAIITSLGVVFMPRLAKEDEKGTQDSVRHYMQNGINFSLMLSMPIMVGIFILSGTVVPWFFGAGYDRITGLLQIFAPLMVLTGLSNFIGNQYLVASHQEGKLSITILLGIVINILLDCFLIPRYASFGAAAATVIAEMVKLVSQMCLARSILQIKKIFKSAIAYGFFALVMGSVVALLKYFCLSANTMMNTFLLVAAGALVYILLLLVSDNYYLWTVLSYARNKLS